MKKLLAITLALACLLGLTACGGGADSPSAANPVKTDDEKLEGPPELYLKWTGGEFTTVKGGFDWNSDAGFGNISSSIACGAHALQCKDLLEPPAEIPAGIVELDFDTAPDAVTSIKCWSDEHWDDPTAPFEELTLEENRLILREGGNIYSVTASWERDKYSGTCDYFFYAVFTPPTP